MNYPDIPVTKFIFQEIIISYERLIQNLNTTWKNPFCIYFYIVLGKYYCDFNRITIFTKGKRTLKSSIQPLWYINLIRSQVLLSIALIFRSLVVSIAGHSDDKCQGNEKGQQEIHRPLHIHTSGSCFVQILYGGGG